MDKKIYSQKIGDEFVVVDSEAKQSYVVSEEQHDNLLTELGSTSRRDLLKAMGVAALATPILATGMVPNPAAAASGGVAISMATVANQMVTATVTNPAAGPNPLVINGTAVVIDAIFPAPPAMGGFSFTAITPSIFPINVAQSATQDFMFDINPDPGTTPGGYNVQFTFTITTATGTCEAVEAVFITV